MTELEPCPKCGAKNPVENVDWGYWWVECQSCHYQGLKSRNPNIAIDNWNKLHGKMR